MDALFNSLKRGTSYSLRLADGSDSFAGVFHEVLPDGTLLFARRGCTFHVNPALVIFARDVSEES